MVKRLERLAALAWIYVVGSFFLGPAIFLGGYELFTQGSGDYCQGPASGFRAAQIFQVTGAGIMLAVGLVLLANLWVNRHRISRDRFALSGWIIGMMCGYVLVIMLSGRGFQSC